MTSDEATTSFSFGPRRDSLVSEASAARTSSASVIPSHGNSLNQSLNSQPKRRASSLLLGLFSATSQSASEKPASSGAVGVSPGTGRRSANAARLKSDMLALLSNDASSDLLIVVGSDRIEFRVHRLILSTRSEFFRAEISSIAPGSSQLIIELPFLDPDAFRIILRFLYTGEEEDEATSPTTNDWRLVIECYQAAQHLGLHERAFAYQRVFYGIFQTCDPFLPEGLEEAREMWSSATRKDLRELLIACAPAFWVVFGSQSNSNQGTSSGKHLLVEVPLDTLIRIINAIPENLESAVGRFRLAKMWMLSQPLTRIPALDGEDDGFFVGQHYDDATQALEMDDEQELLMSPPATPMLETSQVIVTSVKPTPLSARDSSATIVTSTSRSRRPSATLPDATCPLASRPVSASPTRFRTQSPTASPKSQGTYLPSNSQQIAQYKQLLLNLNLNGLTGAQILREVEPSNIFSTSHILQLYRAAAAASPSGGGSGAASTWIPVPCGFRGRRPSSWNSRTKWVTVGGSSAGTQGGNVTYCTVEALGISLVGGSGGKYMWTVMPLHGVGHVGIGVSADVGVSGGGASTGVEVDIMERLESGVSSLFGAALSRRGSVVGDAGESGSYSGVLSTARFVGDDGGWSLWSDGTLRVGRIFVGRLPAGITFSRGSQVTVKLDLDARTLGFDVNGVECGIAFRNLPAVLYPSVAIGDGASVSISPIKRIF
ncbi:hypothetical protein BC830DRAFT_1141236 [Chytriomyces sp. MP71]|nr:hypothetical protein BC830DRAFT_1141236 [Chytriomyces sp. MP71]